MPGGILGGVRMLSRLKAWFQGLMGIVASALHKLGFNPNAVSILGFALGVSSGIAYWAAGSLHMDLNTYRTYLLLATILLLLSGLCDALDGALARMHGKVTVFGGFLDSIVDRYVDSAVLLGIMIGGLCNIAWGSLALVGSLLTSYVRAKAECVGIKMESVGLIERAERIIIISVSTLVQIAWLDLPALEVGVMALAIASNFTVIQRVLHFHDVISREASMK